MEGLTKLKYLYFKEGIPKHLTSGVCIHHSLGMVSDAQWGIDIVITRDDHSSVPFNLQDNLWNVSIQVKLNCFGLKRKVFAFGTIHFAINVFPTFEMSICKKQFHHSFEENSAELRIECATRKLDPQMLEYLRNIKNYLYVGGDVNFYSVEGTEEAKRNADMEAVLFMQNTRFKPLSDLSKDIKSMYVNSVFTDLELRCGFETFHVHKAVLASRSPVFDAMFQNPMKERTENVVVIEDMDSQTLNSMLEYIYSGQINELYNPSTCELLSAADKYQLQGLKDICVDFLQNDITVNNVLRMLVYADLYDELLKKCAIDFICKHYDCVKSTLEWNNLKLERSKLVMEVMDFIIQSLNKNSS